MTGDDEPQLTKHERVALTVVALGYTQPVAARHLGISMRTLRRTVLRAVIRMGATHPTHAVALAAATGQIDLHHLRERVLPEWPEKPQQDNSRRAQLGRRARYVRYRRQGLTVEEAAVQVGVVIETARKYEQIPWIAQAIQHPIPTSRNQR